MAFMRHQATRIYSPRELLNQRYIASRNNLLLVIIFTVVNCIFALLGFDTYFLFSAFVPYYAALMGMTYSGRMSEEFYQSIGESPESMALYNDGFLAIMLVIAAVGTALYFLAWLLSKNHKIGWLIFALVFFSLDTLMLFMIIGIDVTMIVDYIFHAWVIFELARGISVHFKWKNMVEEPIAEGVANGEFSSSASGEPEADEVQDSTPLRSMDRDAKSRVLAEAELGGHKICYRRVKKVNELVVDGMVYDEYVATMEMRHELYARVGGHDICVGYDGARSYIFVDGNQLVSKMRWY